MGQNAPTASESLAEIFPLRRLGGELNTEKRSTAFLTGEPGVTVGAQNRSRGYEKEPIEEVSSDSPCAGGELIKGRAQRETSKYHRGGGSPLSVPAGGEAARATRSR